MLDFWTFIERRLDRGEPVFTAHVAHNTRHSPGTAGAQLAVSRDGTTFGTIGGGIMEADVLEEAEQALTTGTYPPRTKHLFHRKAVPQNHSGATSGLGCAGDQTNIYQVLRPDTDGECVSEIVARLRADRAGVVHISATGMTLKEGQPEQIEAPYRFERTDPWEFSLQLLNWKRIAIVGGGHCGLALSRVMSQLGYAVTIFDNRPDVVTFSKNDYATHRVAVDDYREAGDSIDHRSWTHVVVMTANIDDDIRALLGVAEGPYPYVGVMGAPAKLASIGAELKRSGISDEAIDRFYAPVGLPMTSNTPQEIAISIAAEILAERETLFSFTRPPES